MKTKILYSLKADSMENKGLDQLTNRIFGSGSPSIRVPVTAANREYLRSIRQAELEAWRKAPGGTQYAASN